MTPVIAAPPPGYSFLCKLLWSEFMIVFSATSEGLVCEQPLAKAILQFLPLDFECEKNISLPKFRVRLC